MDSRYPLPPPLPTADIEGIGRVVLPPQTSLYQEFNHAYPNVALLRDRNGVKTRTRDSDSRDAAINPGLAKPWWQRLFVDAMLVPFIQGFMLNIAIHWTRHWRRSGGLAGVIRRRFIAKRQPAKE